MSIQSSMPQRKLSDYKNLSRSVALNHLKREIKKAKVKASQPKANGEFRSSSERKLHVAKEFLRKTFWNWIKYYVINRFGANAAYRTYNGTDTGVYRLVAEQENVPVKIGILSDWATYTRESCEIAEKMGTHNPHYTIHLGDTYYVGDPKEIKVNFLDQNAPWIKGSKGSFVLLGNHEMYARGIAYFRDLLQAMGNNFKGQGASYFCLENDYWRILGLDTGYHSVGKLPLVELILRPDCHLDKNLISWLKDTVKLGDPNDKRGIVILTHHQYITAFKGEHEFTKPAEQLSEIIGKDKPVIWLFGHEHIFSMYRKAQVGKGVMAYCRCIGNGGMPIESTSHKTDESKAGYKYLMIADTRENIPGTGLGYNGYALFEINADKLVIKYCDSNEVLVIEEWQPANGELSGRITYLSDVIKYNKASEIMASN